MRRIGIIGVGLLGSGAAATSAAGHESEDLAAVITSFEYLAGIRS